MNAMKRLTSTRLARGTAVGIYGQLAQLGIQLISVPIFALHWGLNDYGVWLILFTIPGMLSLGDFGLGMAGGNAMTSAVSQGDLARASRIYSSLRWAALVSCGVALFVAALLLVWISPELLDFAQTATRGRALVVTLCLLCYGALALLNSISLAGYRAADAFAYSGLLYQTALLIEAVVALGMVLSGAGMAAVAISYLGGRVALTTVLGIELRRLVPWVRISGWRPYWHELGQLAKPAIAAVVMTAANAAVLQGAVVVIGARVGPAAVPAFTIVRTLSRTALQFIFRFNLASMPRFTVAAAQGDEKRKAQLLLVNMIASIGVLIPTSAAFLLFGLSIVGFWTGGVVHPSFALLALMVAAMLLNGMWVPVSNLIMAVNRHASYTYFYLAVALLCITICAAIAPQWGTTGVAAVLAAMELIMLVRISRLIIRQSIFDLDALGAACGEMRSWCTKALRRITPQ